MDEVVKRALEAIFSPEAKELATLLNISEEEAIRRALQFALGCEEKVHIEQLIKNGRRIELYLHALLKVLLSNDAARVGAIHEWIEKQAKELVTPLGKETK